MARVTVEDCLDKLGNHFKVVQVAGHRARQLETGAAPKVEPEGDKSAVIALREIAESRVTEAVLDEPIGDMADLDSELSQLFTRIEPGPMVSPEDTADESEEDSESDEAEETGDNEPDNVTEAAGETPQE